MKEKHYEDLEQIRFLMEKSTRFMSLSGWSGIMAGIYSLIGFFIGRVIIANHNITRSLFIERDVSYLTYNKDLLIQLILVCVGVILFTIITGWYLSSQKSKKQGLPLWTKATKKMVLNLAIPLIAGGIFCLAMLLHNIIGFIAPSMLIFYGISLLNAGKYTLQEFHHLGLCEIAVGLISLFFIGYGIYFWAFGFGVLHIIYGIIMQRKYK